MRLDFEFADVAYISGDVPSTTVLEYLRQHMELGTGEMPPGKMVFRDVTIKGASDAKRYYVELSQRGTRSELVIRDVTRPPAPAGLSERERWERAGIAPDGKLLNQDQLR